MTPNGSAAMQKNCTSPCLWREVGSELRDKGAPRAVLGLVQGRAKYSLEWSGWGRKVHRVFQRNAPFSVLGTRTRTCTGAVPLSSLSAAPLLYLLPSPKGSAPPTPKAPVQGSLMVAPGLCHSILSTYPAAVLSCAFPPCLAPCSSLLSPCLCTGEI